jgi:hypothetical protein
MGTTTDTAKELVDQLADQQQVLAAAQAKHAKLMIEFADTRRRLDQTRITNLRGDDADPRYTAGEFAALEIGLAITANKTACPAPSASPADSKPKPPTPGTPGRPGTSTNPAPPASTRP